VNGASLFDCTELFPSLGNSIVLDNTPNNARFSEFIGCNFQGTNQSGLTEQRAAVVSVNWDIIHARFIGCTFVVGSHTSDWLYVVNLNAGSKILFEGCEFGPYFGSPLTHTYNLNGATGANGVAFRNCPGLNPFGTQSVAVPATTVATGVLPFDCTFYVTAGSTSCAIAVSGVSSVTIPANAFAAIFVPAGAALTPTYTNAPTWVVAGN
jgi:hypothetical protein